MTRVKWMPFSLLFCLAALAGCGGGGGAGVGGAGGPAGSSPPRQAYTSYGTYGDWYRDIDAKLAEKADCADSCPIDIPPFDFTNYRSPFGANAAFDESNDRWEAEWRGPVKGVRSGDPDGSGPNTPHWDGTAVLRIESPNWANVLFWTEDTNYLQTDGERGGQGPDQVPANVGDAWTAALSTAQGQKGHFSFVDGDRVAFHGQFSAAPAGATPSRAIGHFQATGQTGVFNVSN